MRRRDSTQPPGGFVILPLRERPSAGKTFQLDEQALEIVLRLRISLHCTFAVDDDEGSESG
jgi:hypothetical protein